MERLLGFLFSLFLQQDIIRDELQRFLELQADQTAKNRLVEYVRLYTTVEHTLLSQQPPVVARTLTRDELNKEILNRFPLDLLPEAFGIIFKSSKQQYLYLGQIIITTLANFIIKSGGPARFKAIQDSLPAVHPLRSVQLGEHDALVWTATQTLLDQYQEEVLIAAYLEVVTKLYDDIGTHFGYKTALELIESMYDEIKHSYGYSVVSGFLDLLPTHVLEDERLTFLSREELENKITQAKVIERSREEFFSIASHELRTPLTAIRGYAELLEKLYSEKLNDEQFTGFVIAIKEGSSRLIDIVNDFLNVSGLEQGKIAFDNKPLNITQLLDAVHEDMNAVAAGKQIALEKHYKPEEVEVTADPNRLKQVLINLLGNAIKFSEQGTVSIGLELTDRSVEILITDTGRGIGEEKQQLLFRKFQQAGDSLITRDASRGTGLGLYISKLIMEGLGGKIYLKKSVLDEGSTFAVLLPRTK